MHPQSQQNLVTFCNGNVSSLKKDQIPCCVRPFPENKIVWDFGGFLVTFWSLFVTFLSPFSWPSRWVRFFSYYGINRLLCESPNDRAHLPLASTIASSFIKPQVSNITPDSRYGHACCDGISIGNSMVRQALDRMRNNSADPHR